MSAQSRRDLTTFLESFLFGLMLSIDSIFTAFVVFAFDIWTLKTPFCTANFAGTLQYRPKSFQSIDLSFQAVRRNALEVVVAMSI